MSSSKVEGECMRETLERIQRRNVKLNRVIDLAHTYFSKNTSYDSHLETEKKLIKAVEEMRERG
jgi:hypothetical protein